jgi:hypothetical protein
MRTLNLSSFNVLDHCVQNLTPLKLSLFLNYSTYFPKLVAPLFSPISFVVLLKVLPSHQIMSVITLSIVFKVLRSIVNASQQSIIMNIHISRLFHVSQ